MHHAILFFHPVGVARLDRVVDADDEVERRLGWQEPDRPLKPLARRNCPLLDRLHEIGEIAVVKYQHIVVRRILIINELEGMHCLTEFGAGHRNSYVPLLPRGSLFCLLEDDQVSP